MRNWRLMVAFVPDFHDSLNPRVLLLTMAKHDIELRVDPEDRWKFQLLADSEAHARKFCRELDIPIGECSLLHQQALDEEDAREARLP